MSSNRASNPVKLFVGVLALEDAGLEERLEEKLISEFGPSDHRLSLIPTDGTFHCVFLSFDRLIETGSLPKIRDLSQSIAKEFSVKLETGFVDNRRVAAGTVVGEEEGEDVIQFKNGEIHFLPGTHPVYRSNLSRNFFLSMRKTYRSQLRTMCLLRR